MKMLVLGGARSGKSAFAEQTAQDSGLEVVYVATAEAKDAEMQARIARHRAHRPPTWELVEEPTALAAALQAHAAIDRCLLVDCLTLWLSNLLAVNDACLEREKAALLDILPRLPGRVIMVSNEVGQGIVPLHPIARRFRDEAGLLHQAVARHCTHVVLVVAGLPLHLKKPGSAGF